MSSLARIIETTLSVAEVNTTESTDAVYLNWADKFSVQVVATVGACIANLEASNNGTDWVEISDESIAESASFIFEVPNVSYLYSRVTIAKDDVVDVSADCKYLVIGDSI